MSQNIDLKELRKKIYLSYHQDGLIDIIIGASILGFGLQIATDNSAFLFLTWMGFILYTPLKNRLTVPRLGYVRFDEERKTTMRLVLMVAVGILVLAMFIGLYVFILSDSMPQTLSDWLRKYHMLVLGTFIAIPLIAAAFWMGVKRLIVYAGLTIVVILAGIQLEIPAPVYIIALGCTILLSGLWILFRFLRQYPIVSKDKNHAAE